MKLKILAALILIIAVLVGAFIGVITAQTWDSTVVLLLPNEGQLQMILNAVEPNSPLKVDYHIGTDSRGKWNRIVYNAYAKPHFEEKE